MSDIDTMQIVNLKFEGYKYILHVAKDHVSILKIWDTGDDVRDAVCAAMTIRIEDLPRIMNAFNNAWISEGLEH